MYLLIITLPIIGSLGSGFLGRLLGVQGAIFFTSLCMGISALLTIVAFYEVALCGSPVSIELGYWFFESNWAFLFDSLSCSMLLAVLIVSFVVHIFAGYYMGHDPHVQRFFSLLSGFTSGMIILVTGDNYLMLFLGWEAIGVVSFLLISFWWTRIDAVRSALQAVLYNRVGDTLFSLAIMMMIWQVGTTDFGIVLSLNTLPWNTVCLLLLGGAMAKSAQVPFHIWLPNSMEGPTPVSSLLHAATLVTAGVYLMLRSSPLLSVATDAQLVVAFVGSLTALFAATTGLVQNDLKRVIAYSTCSQIGYMIAAAGLGYYDISLFHLCNHAFFKALLFLGAGGVLHGMVGEQDIRRLGGLLHVLPYTYAAMLIASLALIAFPFTTGMYSKEMLINLAPSPVYECLLAAAVMTAFYSTRLLWRTFMGKPRSVYGSNSKPFGHEVPYTVIFSYTVLALCAIFFGWLAQDAFIGPGSDMLTSLSLEVKPGLMEAESGHPLLPTFATFFGIALYLSGFFAFGEMGVHKGNIYNFLINRWYWDDAFQAVPRFVMNLGESVRKYLDRGALEIVGPQGLGNSIYNISERVANEDRMTVTNIALFMAVIAISLAFTGILPLPNEAWNTSNVVYLAAFILLFSNSKNK